MKKYAVTVDLGGTKILSALIDENDNILDREKVSTELNDGVEGIVDGILESVDNLLKRTEKHLSELTGICLGIPGIINPFEGYIYNAPNIFIKDYNIKKDIQSKLNVPLYLENDVNLGALGIKRVEYKNNVKNMLVVFIGTGIGAALILNGKLYRGSSFFAGEIGHMLLNMTKDRTKKSNYTFENFASRTATVARIIEDIQDGKESDVNEYVLNGKKIKSKALANAVENGDQLVIEHLTDSSKIIGNLLGNLQTLMNFDTIVLGGGVVEATSGFMIPKIKKAFEKSYFDVTGKDTKIIATTIGDDAPLLGGWEVIKEGIELGIK